MENYHPFSKRLLRFMASKWPTKKAFAEDVGLSPQSFGQNYLKETPFPGAEFFARLSSFGCDLNWLITGYGRPPEPVTREESDWWISYCENQIRYWQARIELETQFVREQGAVYDAAKRSKPAPVVAKKRRK